MSKMKVSVLVTFYNQEDYVDRALQSIIEQKADFEYEILIGDDGSSDGTVERVKEWMNRYPDKMKLFVMSRDGQKAIGGFRASKNRLNLLKYVQGQYFIYLDGDDFFENEQKLKKQVEILEDEANQDCIGCGHNIDMLFPDGKRKKATPEWLQEGKLDLVTYWKNIYIHTDTLLFRSEVIPKIPVELLKNNFNDNLITFTMMQHGKIYYYPESMAVYLQTGDGIWTGEKNVVNQVRSLFLFDLCNQINPKLRKITAKRFTAMWLQLIKIRKQIKAEELKILEQEAVDKNMTYSIRWIHYNDLSMWKRGRLLAMAVRQVWKLMVRRCMVKIYRMIFRKKN